MWPIWVSMERSVEMQHSDEGIMLIGLSGKKWEQTLSDSKLSFVFTKTGGHTTKMVRMEKDEIPDRLMVQENSENHGHAFVHTK